jgi:hypothetical protein
MQKREVKILSCIISKMIVVVSAKLVFGVNVGNERSSVQRGRRKRWVSCVQKQKCGKRIGIL